MLGFVQNNEKLEDIKKNVVPMNMFQFNQHLIQGLLKKSQQLFLNHL